MKIQTINVNNKATFQKKLSKPVFNDLKYLIKHTNSKTKTENCVWDYLGCLLLKDNNKQLGSFTPGNYLVRAVKNPYIGISKISLNKGKKSSLDVFIDNKTGEITRTTKKWYQSCRKVEKQVANLVNQIKSNLDNPEKVEERYVSSHVFSREQIEKVNEIQETLYKH